MMVTRGAALALLGVVLAWRVLVNGLAEYYAAQDTPEADAGALRWRGGQATALYHQGLALVEHDPAAARRLFQVAAWANPTDALVYLALAELQAGAGQTSAAIALVETADALGPMRTPALARSAAFWLTQSRPDLALARWDMLLRNRPEVADQLYPLLLHWVESAETRALLRPLLANPPTWWDRFFTYVAAKSTRLETVVYLYRNRERGGKLPEATEQKVYLERLWREGHWLETYLAWLGGLDQSQQGGLGNLYNGGFELPVTGIGFDWSISTPRGAQVEITETYGTHGGKALHVTFNGQRVRFRHVWQPLYLEPGHYRLQGRARPDGLRAERGIRWTVRCAASDDRLLVEGPLFTGSDDWRLFTQDFTVPEANCPVQRLRLELEGRAELDFEVQGGIWFDDLAIIRQE
ncbi:MAG: hypothetical protein KDJ54_00085 [Candidatus Competibacteraceae bacterium]|nr:hypothetical protein [Candidatus Competibacteraceae bacterium]